MVILYLQQLTEWLVLLLKMNIKPNGLLVNKKICNLSAVLKRLFGIFKWSYPYFFRIFRFRDERKWRKFTPDVKNKHLEAVEKTTASSTCFQKKNLQRILIVLKKKYFWHTFRKIQRKYSSQSLWSYCSVLKSNICHMRMQIVTLN